MGSLRSGWQISEGRRSIAGNGFTKNLCSPDVRIGNDCVFYAAVKGILKKDIGCKP